MPLFANARAQVIGHNYADNHLILYRSKQIDSWDNDDENCSVNFFILTKFGGDNTYQSMNVKSYVQNNSIRIIHHNYMNNGRTLNWSKRMDSWDNDNEDWIANYYFLT